MLKDLLLALRRIRRAPLFAAIIIATLALGIGATGAVLTLVDAVLLDALPYNDAGSLAFIRGEMHRDGEDVRPYPIGYLDAEALAADRSLFTHVAPITGPRPFNLATDRAVEHVSAEMTNERFLSTLGVPLAAGRWFTAQESSAPGARVAVISHALWLRIFAGSPQAVGASLRLNEQPYQVIGVAGQGFNGVGDDAQLWLPIGLAGGIYGPHYLQMREFRWLSVVARQRPGLTAEGLHTGLRGLSARLEQEFPKENKGLQYVSQPLADAYFGSFRKPLAALTIGAALVLLIGCANVANLMLIREAGRRREIAARVAIGATTPQLLRMVMADMLTTGLISGAIGLLLAWGGARLIAASGAVELQSFTTLGVNLPVVGTVILLSVVCAALFGAAPALHATTLPPHAVLRDGSRGASSGKGANFYRRGLVAAEVAIAIALLVAAGLVTKGFTRFVRTDLGFAADSVVAMRLDLTADRYKTNEPVFTFAKQLLREARAVPGAERVALEGPSYPTGGWFAIHLVPVGVSDPQPLQMRRHHVSTDYFATLGIRRIEGRDFDDTDVASGAKSIIVGERLARRLAPNGSAIGKQLMTQGATPTALTVVGVVADVEHAGLDVEAVDGLDVYLPMFQYPPRSPTVMTLMVRTAQPTAPVLAALRDRLRTLDSNLDFYNVRTLRDLLDDQTRTGRFLIVLMSTFGVVGLLLAAIGVYGVISFGVSQRVREIGIRMALGANARAVVRAVVRDALVPVAVGAAAGIVVVMLFHRSIATLLYGMGSLDVPTIAGAVAVILSAAMVASLLPAWRASRIDPVEALRAEG
ncbi:MAG TPA: ABC transporter permease [Gemmatimonadaceae bacterium]|nr:ABC transporter permease [Gemmatimonadaceae bacterium]